MVKHTNLYWNGLISQWFETKICHKSYFNHWISIEIEKSIKWQNELNRD
jgi:hypothetical protein